MKHEKLFLIVLLIGWYYLSYKLFFYKDLRVGESPELRARLGTILSHSSDKNGQSGKAMFDPDSKTHTYCYYPKGSTQYSGKSGEYIIKRQDNEDCSGWYGKAIFHEGWWVSEKEKIWWSKDQKMNEELAVKKVKINTI